MFVRSFASKDRAGKAVKPAKRSFGSDAKARMLERSIRQQYSKDSQPPNCAIITVVVGRDQRLFAAHEDVLCRSPFFREACRALFLAPAESKRLNLLDEEAETFSAVLEFLYKGDYYPRLLQDKKRNLWFLEGSEEAAFLPSQTSLKQHEGPVSRVATATMHHSAVGDVILRDTAVYCAGERFGLDELKRLALRKQGLQSGIEVGTILRSMRFAYAHTPETDSRLRAHYLALIVRSRRTFKRSGTMQMEMARGGSMFFDLFVAMCNHLDDVSCATPKTI